MSLAPSPPSTSPVQPELAPVLPSSDEAPVWNEEFEVREPQVGIDDIPPPAETLLYAWQHTLVDVSPYVLPLVVTQAVGYSAAQGAYMISACLALTGNFTFINATWGIACPR